MPKQDSTKGKARSEVEETGLLVKHGFQLSRQLGINRVLVLASLISDQRLVERRRDSESLIWVTAGSAQLKHELKAGDHAFSAPEHLSSGADLVTFTLLTAVLAGAINPDETVLCLTGAAGSKRLDNLLIVNPYRDFSWFKRGTGTVAAEIPEPQTFIRLVEIALRFGAEGREGKSIGTILLMCDPRDAESVSRPLILNPCEGHPNRSKNVFDDEFVETMRELAALDGAFVIDKRGVVKRAGVYLDAPATAKVKVSRGLGARHMAAASISGAIDGVAIVVSESSGAVTVFSGGKEALCLRGRAAQ